ncbi:MAG TPA: sigma-70 family RNA polymerase sigma factor [Blastocatellia bacterium]|nr:sigma-70 family RNA polymerase sigma factor [Blastocatellia bacterium]
MTAQAELPSAERNRAARTQQEQELVHLMNAIAQGDQEALAAFYDQTHRLVFGLALRILGNRESAEEVTSDVYMQVWRQAANFELMRGTALSWLMTIARTRSIDRLRASSHVRQETETLDTVVQYSVPGDSPEKQTIYAERSRQVRQALRQLTPEQRALIEAAYFEGLSQSELAERFALPLGTVKTRVRAGMVILKKHFSVEH